MPRASWFLHEPMNYKLVLATNHEVGASHGASSKLDRHLQKEGVGVSY